MFSQIGIDPVSAMSALHCHLLAYEEEQTVFTGSQSASARDHDQGPSGYVSTVCVSKLCSRSCPIRFRCVVISIIFFFVAFSFVVDFRSVNVFRDFLFKGE